MISIALDDVSARRGGREVLQGFRCAFAPGTFNLLLGASGSGKSTLLRVLNRLTEKSQGSVLLNGTAQEAMDLYVLRRQFGFVPQDLGLFPHRTVGQQIRLANPEAKVHALLERMGLEAVYEARYPRELSGGEQQRAALARAMAANPPVLLLDEAFSALDPPLRRDLLAAVAGLGCTVILASHDPVSALPYAAQVLFLDRGRLLFAGTVEQYRASRVEAVVRYREACEC